MIKIKILKCIQIIAAVIFITAVFCVCMELYKDYSDKKAYADLFQEVCQPNGNDSIIKLELNDKEEDILYCEDKADHYVIDYEKLISVNSDCIGWINACGGVINYPIVKTEDNQFYLKHGFDGKSNKAGCLFVENIDDTRDIFEEFHIAIYGHNMKNGTMFHELLQYKSEEYMKEHPYIYVNTPDGESLTYEVFAAYYKDESQLPIYFDNSDISQREAFIKAVNKRSDYTLETDDKIISLVTCEYSGNNNRMVVHAKLIERNKLN